MARIILADVVCLGGFDNRKMGVLYSGSKQAVKDETKRLA